ncbi:hypothetical protein [Erythrobacter sp.]|uniref:hypothetical protein n=1 Tax=Erythrobacter sp. TaxID=1042 RepID=UPI001425EC72|nr:hypothetical protein [Erythrobacter sp.]QIQ85899.1 MAG: hypothetical protein G9473_03755 [Erythrobacter sp.]
MRLAPCLAGLAALLAAPAVASPCAEIERLVAAAGAEQPFAALAPELAEGARRAMYDPDPALDIGEGNACTIWLPAPLGPKMLCGMNIADHTDRENAYLRALDAFEYHRDRLKACALLGEGEESDEPGLQSMTWVLPERQVVVELSLSARANRSREAGLSLQVKHASAR